MIVGQKEIDNNTINVRYRDKKDKKEVTIEELLKEIKENIEKFK